jgi:hypothetical protein
MTASNKLKKTRKGSRQIFYSLLHSPTGSDEIRLISNRTAVVLADIRTGNLLYTNRNRYRSSHLTQFTLSSCSFKTVAGEDCIHCEYCSAQWTRNILKPIWTYGIQLCGSASISNIETLERFQLMHHGTCRMWSSDKIFKSHQLMRKSTDSAPNAGTASTLIPTTSRYHQTSGD